MQDNNNVDLGQLLTAKEAGDKKGMPPNQTAYHLGRPGAPKPVLVGKYKHPYYLEPDIDAWQPKREPRKSRKNTRKGNDQPGK